MGKSATVMADGISFVVFLLTIVPSSCICWTRLGILNLIRVAPRNDVWTEPAVTSRGDVRPARVSSSLALRTTASDERQWRTLDIGCSSASSGDTTRIRVSRVGRMAARPCL